MKKGVSKYYFFLGFLAFLGFKGINNEPLYLLNFAFGGYFAYIWWAKLVQFDDKHLKYHKFKAASLSFSICFAIAFVLSIVIKLTSFDLQTGFKLQLLIVSLAFAVSINLWAFLTYKFSLAS
ncbi:DUF3796 domain-containing protein [Alkaliphilus transvaalensis]|uniref:DUF3796 domain-containing protein n=1 Tax=Alkaliphilus transvaalensis TaxID=114628 RepID=UPI00047D0B1A|nr:DUF3796 domain-containing protein [Alkaliphilus transvaalensis]